MNDTPETPALQASTPEAPKAERAPRALAEAVTHSRNGAAEATRRAGAAVAATMHHFGHQLGDETADPTLRSAEAPAEVVQAAAAPGYTSAVTAQWQQTAHKMLEAAQATARDIRTLMVLPHQPGSHLHDMQQALGTLLAGVVQGQFDAAHDLFRLTDPGSILQSQQRFVRNYLDTLMQGSAIMVQSARATLRQAEAAASPTEDRHSRIGDVMQRDVRIASPEDTVQQAARMMREADTGVLPVGDAEHLVGIVSDRELALCLAAEGRDPARTKVREVMTSDISYVFEDEELEPVAENMAEQRVRRLTVLDREKRLVGVVTLADLAARRRAA